MPLFAVFVLLLAKVRPGADVSRETGALRKGASRSGQQRDMARWHTPGKAEGAVDGLRC